RALALCFAEPELKSLKRFVPSGWTNHLDESCGAADKRCAAGGFMGVLGICPHEGQKNVNMRVNETGEDIFPRGIDHLGVRRSLDVPVDSGDRFVLAEDVSCVAVARCYNLTVL